MTTATAPQSGGILSTDGKKQDESMARLSAYVPRYTRPLKQAALTGPPFGLPVGFTNEVLQSMSLARGLSSFEKDQMMLRGLARVTAGLQALPIFTGTSSTANSGSTTSKPASGTKTLKILEPIGFRKTLAQRSSDVTRWLLRPFWAIGAWCMSPLLIGLAFLWSAATPRRSVTGLGTLGENSKPSGTTSRGFGAADLTTLAPMCRKFYLATGVDSVPQKVTV